MKAILTKVDPMKSSENGDYDYMRGHFTLENGNYAFTRITPSFRNYNRWGPVVESGIGTVIEGVEMKGDKLINADSLIKIIGIEKTNIFLKTPLAVNQEPLKI